MDRYTDLDPRAFLVGLAATGAVAAAAFAGRQTQLAREHTRLTLLPHLSIESVIPGANGLGVTLRNHGGGLAAAIKQSAVLMAERSDFEAEIVTPEWIADADGIAKTIKQDMGSLGAGLTKTLLLFEWDAPPMELGAVFTLATLFEFMTLADGKRSNPQVLEGRFQLGDPLRPP